MSYKCGAVGSIEIHDTVNGLTRHQISDRWQAHGWLQVTFRSHRKTRYRSGQRFAASLG